MQLLQDKVRGQFGQDIGHEEDRDGDLEARAGQLELAFQTVEARVADVDAVEEGLGMGMGGVSRVGGGLGLGNEEGE